MDRRSGQAGSQGRSRGRPAALTQPPHPGLRAAGPGHTPSPLLTAAAGSCGARRGRWGWGSSWDQGQGHGTYIFGGLAEDVTHAATIAQPVVHNSDNAHQESVTGPLCAVWLLLYKWTAHSDPGQWPLCPPPPMPTHTPPSPSRTSGTDTSETQSTLSPLQVPTNVAAPCGIPRGLAGRQ